VLGLYDKGKTHILNQISSQNLPTGSKITTKGISFKQCIVDNNNQFVLIDTAGSYAPENMKNMKEK
jgi:GTPase Era involved in 16S rRNA processing